MTFASGMSLSRRTTSMVGLTSAISTDAIAPSTALSAMTVSSTSGKQGEPVPRRGRFVPLRSESEAKRR